LHREIWRSAVPGILATASIISGTVLAVFALGINVEKA